LLAAGIIDRPIDRGVGMTPADRTYLLESGVGITNIVRRATAKASELSAQELREGGEQLREFVRVHRPAVVAVAGITAYRTAFGVPKATMGEQPGLFEGARLFAVPNPSGLNAHETVASIAVAYREPASAAGVIHH
jgi:TDG/mug DNA glycosylase family protein